MSVLTAPHAPCSRFLYVPPARRRSSLPLNVLSAPQSSAMCLSVLPVAEREPQQASRKSERSASGTILQSSFVHQCSDLSALARKSAISRAPAGSMSALRFL